MYEELRKLAAHRLANEKPGQTLQATALVHEAYLKLVGSETRPVVIDKLAMLLVTDTTPVTTPFRLTFLSNIPLPDSPHSD